MGLQVYFVINYYDTYVRACVKNFNAYLVAGFLPLKSTFNAYLLRIFLFQRIPALLFSKKYQFCISFLKFL